MPSQEAGFYQLTALLPIKDGPYTSLDCDDIVSEPCASTRSYAHHLKNYLNQLSDSFLKNIDSKSSAHSELHIFDHTRCTHFARFVVIDQLFYNGRRRNDSLIDFFRMLFVDQDFLSEKDKIDALESPYLLITIDFDCPPNSTTCIQDYLTGIWPYAYREFTEIFHHCEGFSLPAPAHGKYSSLNPSYLNAYYMVERLILDHEVETTYPFSAYFWAADKVQRWDPLTDEVLPSEIKNRWPLIIIGLLPFALVILALVILPFYLGSLFFPIMYDAIFPRYDLSDFQEASLLWGLITFVLSVASASMFMFAWRYFIKSSNTPLPRIDGVDLKSISKSLYLQQKLFEMFSEWQEHDGFDKAKLRQRFEGFLEANNPSDLNSPTLQPGKFFSTR